MLALDWVTHLSYQFVAGISDCELNKLIVPLHLVRGKETEGIVNEICDTCFHLQTGSSLKITCRQYLF